MDKQTNPTPADILKRFATDGILPSADEIAILVENQTKVQKRPVSVSEVQMDLLRVGLSDTEHPYYKRKSQDPEAMALAEMLKVMHAHFIYS